MRKKTAPFTNKKVFFAQLITWFFLLVLTACSSTASENKKVVNKQDTNDWPEHFGLGQPASAAKIAAIDIDIRPDGKGLPAGSGTVPEGKKLYLAKCASCHGKNGVDGPYNHLVSSDTSKAKTIGNYWPYATTVFDYTRRAMPFTSPGSLSDDEVYNVTAYLLYANELIDSNTVINAKTLPKIEMPAKKLFVSDDRQGGKEIR